MFMLYSVKPLLTSNLILDADSVPHQTSFLENIILYTTYFMSILKNVINNFPFYLNLKSELQNSLTF